MIIVDKPYIYHEKAAKQKEIFNFDEYGKLKFIVVISYRTTNIFFSFYCKAEKKPEKVFLFYKSSLGLEKRNDIRAGMLPKVSQRGRYKQQAYRIRVKYSMLQAYILEFMKHHSEMFEYPPINIVWKIHKFDYNIQTLLTQPFKLKLDSSIKMEETLFEAAVKKHEGDNLKNKKVEKLKKKEAKEKEKLEKEQMSKMLKIVHHFCFKFPHNGCRPRKVRRTKKSRRK